MTDDTIMQFVKERDALHTLLASTPKLLELAAGMAETANCNQCPKRSECSAFTQDTECYSHPCDVVSEQLRKLAQALRAALGEEEEG